MEAPFTVTDEAEVRVIDAQYRPFPFFDEWPSSVEAEPLWERVVSEVEDLAAKAQPRDLHRAMEIAMRTAAFDTGAIEGLYDANRGLTLTVATQAAAWEHEVEELGSNVRALFEAQLSAYELVLDVATNSLPVSEAWIRQLHEEICRPQRTYRVRTPIGEQDHPLPTGEYKRNPNHVELLDGTRHAYAPVDRVADEMHRLLGELDGPSFAAAHPALQASYAHYALVAIHPFADGNGRVARALASVYLYRAARVPLLVFADRRLEYFENLETADRGEATPFALFTFDAGMSAIQLVADTLKTAKAPSPVSSLAEIQRMLTAQGGLTHQEMDRVAYRFMDTLQKVFQAYFAELSLPAGVAQEESLTQIQVDESSGFRSPLKDGGRRYAITVSSSAPANAQAGADLIIFVSKASDEREALQLVADDKEVLSFTLRDVYPEPTAATMQRLNALAERTYGRLLEDVRGGVERALHDRGYL